MYIREDSGTAMLVRFILSHHESADSLAEMKEKIR